MQETKNQVVCFGEVLWDILPGGRQPGGAPVNVAYHLHMHNKKPIVITCIGDDKDGAELKDLFSARGIDTSFFSVDKVHETGKVYGIPDENQNMRYEIVEPVAWDFIPFTEAAQQQVQTARCFVYGSLSARNKTSRDTLFQLIQSANKKILDINLRRPHYNKALLLELIGKANILKLNDEELDLVSDWFSSYKTKEDKLSAISEKLGLDACIVTLGANGAMILIDGAIHHHPGHKVKVADTVGSGDAFLAGLLSKWMENASPPEMLDYASRLGAFVATQHGACPVYDPRTIADFGDLK